MEGKWVRDLVTMAEAVREVAADPKECRFCGGKAEAEGGPVVHGPDCPARIAERILRQAAEADAAALPGRVLPLNDEWRARRRTDEGRWTRKAVGSRTKH